MIVPTDQKIIAEFQQQKGWFSKAYQARFLPWSVQIYGVEQMMKQFPWSMQHGGTISGANGLQSWIWNESEMKHARDYFTEHTIQDVAFLEDFEKEFMNRWQLFLDAEKQYERNVVQANLSIIDQAMAVQQLLDSQSTIGVYGYVTDAFLSSGGEDWLVQRMNAELSQKIEKEKREEVIATLAVPVKDSFVRDEQVDCIRIALLPEEKWEGEIKNHTAQWHWIQNSYIESLPLTEQFFKEKIIELRKAFLSIDLLQQEYESAKERSKMKQYKKQELLEDYNCSDMMRTIISLSDRISHITDCRKNSVLRLTGHIWNFLRRLSEETGQSIELLGWMHRSEVIDLVRTRDWSLLEERHTKGMLYLCFQGEVAFVQGDDFLSIDTSSLIGVEESVVSLHGQVAYKKNVEGIACIILGRNDFDQFQDGDILITNQTTPEFIPLMKRASGVVTEQGGITCHAAIVSRELQIACIIGVQNAMAVFRNGQRIVLDTETGEVRPA